MQRQPERPLPTHPGSEHRAMRLHASCPFAFAAQQQPLNRAASARKPLPAARAGKVVRRERRRPLTALPISPLLAASWPRLSRASTRRSARRWCSSARQQPGAAARGRRRPSACSARRRRRAGDGMIEDSPPAPARWALTCSLGGVSAPPPAAAAAAAQTAVAARLATAAAARRAAAACRAAALPTRAPTSLRRRWTCATRLCARRRGRGRGAAPARAGGGDRRGADAAAATATVSLRLGKRAHGGRQQDVEAATEAARPADREAAGLNPGQLQTGHAQ